MFRYNLINLLILIGFCVLISVSGQWFSQPKIKPVADKTAAERCFCEVSIDCYPRNRPKLVFNFGL